MATGDVQGSLERLKAELRHIRYPAELDCTGSVTAAVCQICHVYDLPPAIVHVYNHCYLCRTKLGVPAAFLPVLNYVLLKFSRHVAHQLVSAGYEVFVALHQTVLCCVYSRGDVDVLHLCL